MADQFTINNPKTTFNAQDKTWSGRKFRSIYDRKTSLGEVLIDALSKAPFTVGQVSCEDGFELRNHEILRNSVRVSLHLRDLDLKQGDVIGVAAGNSRYIAQLIFGAIFNGCPDSTVDPTFGVDDVCNLYRQTEPKLVFCDRSNLEVVGKALGKLKNSAPVYVCDNWDGEHSHPGALNLMTLLQPRPEDNDFE